MTPSALQQAIDALAIEHVWLHGSRSWMAEEFDPEFTSHTSFHTQYRHHVRKSYLMQIEEGTETTYVFRVFLDLGIRLLPGRSNQGDAADDPQTALAQIEATYVTEYTARTDPGTEALEAFSRRNASYHAWPYWREFVASQSQRMRLPRIVVPVVQFAFDRAHNPGEKSENAPERNES